ncbi:hypothetical protein D3C83_164680 [compost metagenome]
MYIIPKKKDAMANVNQPPCGNLLRLEIRNAISIENIVTPRAMDLTVDFFVMEK